MKVTKGFAPVDIKLQSPEDINTFKTLVYLAATAAFNRACPEITEEKIKRVQEMITSFGPIK